MPPQNTLASNYNLIVRSLYNISASYKYQESIVIFLIILLVAQRLFAT